MAGHPAILYLGPTLDSQYSQFRKQALTWSDHGWYLMLVVAPGPTGGTIATLRVPYREMLLEPDDAAR